MQYDCRVEPLVMRSTVNKQVIQFSADQMREPLQFGSVVHDQGPTEYPTTIRNGAFLLLVYSGKVEDTQCR